MNRIFYLTLSLVFLFPVLLFAQFDCDASSTIDRTIVPENQYFLFDNLTKYNGGILLAGATKLHVNVKEQTIPLTAGSPPCKWMLQMTISNAGGIAPSLANEWALQTRYSAPTAPTSYPDISELEVRVTNECGTPYQSGIFQSCVDILTPLIIIQDVKLLPPNAICPTEPLQPPAPDDNQVNGAGDYMQLYSQYTFVIDYRVKITPSSGYTAGIYNLILKFELIEVPSF